MTTEDDLLMLIATASKQAEALRDTLNRLVKSGNAEIAAGIAKGVNESIRLPLASSATEVPFAKPDSAPLISEELESAPTSGTTIVVEPAHYKDSGLEPRDLPQRIMRNRNLRAGLMGDIILFQLARVPSGLAPSDIMEEYARLKVSEPKGTVLSRISRLRSLGLLTDRDEKSSGIYRITSEGHRLAVAAVKNHGFNIDLPPLAPSTK